MKITETKFDWAFALTPRSLTTHLILHHAAAVKATAEGIHAYHRSLGWAGIAYHYFISKNGEVFIGRPENMRGGHTTNWNHCAIGICFEGNFEVEEMPEAQKQAGKALIAEIRGRYPAIVVGRHSDFGQTACPGRNFPFSALTDQHTEQDCTRETAAEPAAWAAAACQWVTEQGLFRGDDAEGFRWRQPVTRQELAVMLQRVFEQIA